MHNGRTRAPVLVALVLGSTLICLGATPVAAANNTVFTAYLGDCQFSGENAGASKTVKIDWRDSDGALKSKHSVTSNSAGKFTTLCEPGELIETGDVLKTTIGTAARTFTVPRITAYAGRVSNSVTGNTSPAPSSLIVVVVKWNGGFTSDYSTTHTSIAQMIGSPGDFETNTWDETPLLEGWDNVFVNWFNARGDVAIRQIEVAGIRLWLRQPFMEMVGNMRTEFAVELQRPTGNWIADYSGRLPYSGYATTVFQNNADNELLRLKSGDHLIVTMPYSRDYDLPTMSATISTSTDKVTFTSNCNLMGPGIAYVVVHNRSYSKSQYRTGYFTPGGQFVANFATSPAYNIAAGDKVDVYCRAMYGDVFAKTFTAG
jgi:hypothetical protein